MSSSEFTRELIEFPRMPVDDEIEFATSKFGQLIMARRMLEPQGRWPALIDDLRRLLENPRPAEYLVTTGVKGLAVRPARQSSASTLRTRSRSSTASKT